MKTTIRQRVIFRASPARVFEAIIDERRHEAFTGARAKISRRVGGAFSCYGGYIKGINLDLVRAKVSGWRSHYWKPLKAYLEK